MQRQTAAPTFVSGVFSLHLRQRNNLLTNLPVPIRQDRRRIPLGIALYAHICSHFAEFDLAVLLRQARPHLRQQPRLDLGAGRGRQEHDDEAVVRGLGDVLNVGRLLEVVDLATCMDGGFGEGGELGDSFLAVGASAHVQSGHWLPWHGN